MAKSPSRKPSLRDIFLNIFTFVMLYIAAFNVGGLLFELINHYIPDIVQNSFRYDAGQSQLKFFLATVIVVFPVYLYFALKLGREQRVAPLLRGATSFRLLTYGTLTITGIIIISSVVRLVFGFINGDLPTRVLLKIAVVAGISAAVFGYYLWNVKQLKTAKSVTKRPFGLSVFLYSILAIVALAVITSFTIIESPSESRARRLDDQRVDDLSSLESSIQWYYNENKSLPPELDDLLDAKQGIRVVSTQLQDPETQMFYGYNIENTREYELCATFTHDNTDERTYRSEQWEHGIGEACFAREVRTNEDPLPKIPLERF